MSACLPLTTIYQCGPPAPCEAYSQRNTKCVFNVDHDQRRRLARSHKADEADFHQRLLHGLLETIRSSEEDRVRDMTRVVQSGAPLSELTNVIDRGLDVARERGSSDKHAMKELHELRNDARGLHDMVADTRAQHKDMNLEPASVERPNGFLGETTAAASEGSISRSGLSIS